MSNIAVSVESGKSVKLPTAGKYCDRDIVVTAAGGTNTGDSTFWSAYQDSGKRTNYRYAFYQSYWNDGNFRPKYDIVPSADGQYVFQNCGVTDMKTILEKQGVMLDLSKTANLYYCFAGAKVTRLPELNCASCGNFQNMFMNCTDLVSIDSITISESATGDKLARMFYHCYALESIAFAGTVNGDLALNDSSLLSRDSIISLLNVLKDGGTGTITLGETNLAKLTDEEKAIATEKGWTLV